MWVHLMAESVVLTCWPPAPEARYVSNFKVEGSRGERDRGGVEGRIITLEVEVWSLGELKGTR